MKIKQLVHRYKLAAFTVGVIVIAIILVSFSMRAYYASDAFRLDLSRPEYLSLRSQIDKENKNSREFDLQGEITAKTLDEFLSMYDESAKKAQEAKAFSGDVLSDQQLDIDEK